MTPILLIAAVVCSIISAPSAAAFGVSEHSIKDDASPRRRFLKSTAAITVASWTGGKTPTPWLSPAFAADDVATDLDTTTEVEMKRFVDNANPSLFVIDVPQSFFAIRRSAKGDLPDAKTGKGRRGGTIFTAGDMSKAEVIAVER